MSQGLTGASEETQDSLWIGVFVLCPHHKGTAGLEPANYRHSGFQALVDLALLASDQQGSDGLALGRPATACSLRGLYRLPHINKPAIPEAGAETCAN